MLDPSTSRPTKKPRVGLLVTCLVDLMRPTIGFAAAKLLEDAGCAVDVPLQSCCGQPAFNSGDRRTARDLAANVIATFEPYDYVVVPSGSCGGMLRLHYPELFADEPAWAERAKTFARKCHELVSFLVDVRGVSHVDAHFTGEVTYHDGCSGLRELGVQKQPRQLLATVQGLQFTEMRDAHVCCGFGGTFCVKYPAVSDAIVGKKVANAVATGAPTVLAGDLGCLMNIAGKAQRLGEPLHVRHVAEVLAGMTDTPPLGESEKSKAGASA